MVLAELLSEVTECLLAKVPSLTAAQVVQVRDGLVELAASHEWVDSDSSENGSGLRLSAFLEPSS
jgi:hypothetical protein